MNGLGKYEERKPLGYEQLASIATSTAVNAPAGTRMAVITCTGQAVRWRDDGTAPTAAVGMPMAVNAVLVYTGNVHALRFIETAVTGIVDISYYN